MSNHPPKLYLDTETCGLHSMMVLLQYAVEDGPITLYEVWRRPIRETLALIEWICQHTVVGFNLSFDWFHVCKIYTIFRLCDPDWIPEEHIDEIAMLEPQGQDGPCVKPAAVLDLMLHSRKGPYQSLMAREDVRIKRVPTALAYALARELEGKVQFDNIYFAKSADPEAPKWQVFDRHDSFGDLDTEFKDVVLKFNPAGGLKFLAEHALKLKPKYHYKDVEPSPAWRPYEFGYAPTALAVSSPAKGWAIEADEGEGKGKKVTKYAWPGVIRKFIDHWATRADARDYANDDIVYTRGVGQALRLSRAGRQRLHLDLHGGRRPLARLHDQPRRDRGPEGEGRGRGRRQPGQHQQAERSPGLRHGRDGRHRGRDSRHVHEEGQPRSDQQVGHRRDVPDVQGQRLPG